MKTLPAAWFDGQSARRWVVTLNIVGGEIVMHGEFGTKYYPLAALEIGEAIGAGERILRFPDDTHCLLAESPLLADWLAELGAGERWIVRLQRRWRWAVAALGAMIVLLVAAYLYALPLAASLLAPLIPDKAVQLLSTQTLATFDEHLLQPSRLSFARQEKLRQRLAELAAHQSLPPYTLHFRHSRLGPNAFALPAGQLVLLDALVDLAENDEEVLGVLAHELGHVAHRHGLRQLIQGSVIAFVAGVYLGDLSSLASGLGTLVLTANYSREFELEADDYAAKLLAAAGYGSLPLISMLQRLSVSTAGREKAAVEPDLLSSHPDVAVRIARLRGNAGH